MPSKLLASAMPAPTHSLDHHQEKQPKPLPSVDAALAYPIPDAARVIGSSRSGIYNLISEGKLTPRRLGGRTLILADDLKRLVHSLPIAPIRQHGNNTDTD